MIQENGLNEKGRLLSACGSPVRSSALDLQMEKVFDYISKNEGN
jgi:hypothetical protein